MIACSSRTGARCPVVAVCAVLGLSAAFAGSAVAGLTVRKKPNIRLQGTYSNDHATIHFRSLRTRARVAAVVTDADGRVLLAVRGNRRDVPQVTFAGIVVTDHGDFSPEEQATLHALRTSPEALALGEMLRAQPAREPDTRDPWAALHDLYKFLTHVGGPGPDGLYQWEERPAPEDQPSLSTTTASLMDVDPDGGGGGGGWGDPSPPPPSGGPYPGAAWNCAGDTDQCIGQSGPGCFGTYVMGTRVHKWNCAALRHDINNRQRDCTLNGSSTTGGCCGTLEDAITAVLTEPDIGR